MASDEEFARAVAGKAYAQFIKDWWLAIIDKSVEQRSNYLKGEKGTKIQIEYVSNLIELWLELYPKIQGSEYKNYDGKSFEEAYRYFQKYYDEPTLLAGDAKDKSKPSNPRDIGRLHETIRFALEKLKITTWE